MSSSLADSLRRSMSGVPAGCSCATTIAEQLRRSIDESDELCSVHDRIAIEQRAAHERLLIERERHAILRGVIDDKAAADLPECSCATVTQLVRSGFAGETLPECALHAGQIPSEQNISVGDDRALLALLGQHGLVPTNDL